MLQVVGIVAFVFAILFSIAWHELGHFIPAKKFGWVQAENETVTITATVTSLDLMCNVVDYRGTIRSTMPRSKAYLTPKVAASAP